MESVIYDGRYSIIFDDKHTWHDWTLIPASRPIIPLPQMNIKEVEIPGRSGSLDLSLYQAGHITYKNRSATFSFYVANDVRSWMDTYTRIANHLLGKKVKIILSEEPKYYYYGYCTPNIGNGEQRLVVQISADLDPFKRPCLLDPSLKNISVSGSKDLVINGTIAYDSPTITTSKQITVTHDGSSWTVPSGTHILYELQLGPGKHTVNLQGTSTVTFDYRGGIF